MTDPQENEDMVKQNDPPELTAENMRAILHIALIGCGGLRIPKAMLEVYPEDAPMKMAYDETNEVWLAFVPKKKRKRGKIISPDKRLIVPV